MSVVIFLGVSGRKAKRIGNSEKVNRGGLLTTKRDEKKKV